MLTLNNYFRYKERYEASSVFYILSGNIKYGAIFSKRICWIRIEHYPEQIRSLCFWLGVDALDEENE